MKKLFITALMCVMALSMSAQYVDLGLPSGTKWKTSNEPGFYTYEEAVDRFASNMPEEWQLQEIIDYCEWTWNGRGYKVVGPNGSFIVFPAAGVDFGTNGADGIIEKVGAEGAYWTLGYTLNFNSRDIEQSVFAPSIGCSVRLVRQ